MWSSIQIVDLEVHWSYSLLFAAKDGEDGNRLKLEQLRNSVAATVKLLGTWGYSRTHFFCWCRYAWNRVFSLLSQKKIKAESVSWKKPRKKWKWNVLKINTYCYTPRLSVSKTSIVIGWFLVTCPWSNSNVSRSEYNWAVVVRASHVISAWLNLKWRDLQHVLTSAWFS